MSGAEKNKLTKENIEKIIQLRKDGMSLLKIADKFKVDHTTVMYHIEKFERVGNVKVQSFWRKLPPKKKKQETYYKVSKGKTYKEYLYESNNRNKKSDIIKLALEKKGFEV